MKVKGACIVWQGSFNGAGYGLNKKRLAHRVAFAEAGNELIPGLVLDHLCRNRACINPDHLEQVTNRENILRGEGVGAKNARKTKCDRGHEFNSDNTYYTKYGKKSLRQCRPCQNIAVRKYRKKIGYGGKLEIIRTRTHCLKGHEYAAGNGHIDIRGTRRCRTCERIKAIKYYYRIRKVPCPL